jgi:hypothetical protein
MLLRNGMNSVDKAPVGCTAQSNLAEKITLDRNQGRFQDLLPYSGQGYEPYLSEFLACIGQIHPDRSILAWTGALNATIKES